MLTTSSAVASMRHLHGVLCRQKHLLIHTAQPRISPFKPVTILALIPQLTWVAFLILIMILLWVVF